MPLLPNAGARSHSLPATLNAALCTLLSDPGAQLSNIGAPPQVTLQKFLSAMRHHVPSRACGAVERDLVFEALERDGADRLERHPIAVPLLLYLLAHENFAGPGVVRDS